MGFNPQTTGAQQALYISYEPATQTWQALFSTPNNVDKVLRLVMEFTQKIDNLASIRFTPFDIYKAALSPVLLIYDKATGKYIDRTKGSGLEQPVLDQSVVAGNFDNDMDIDLYISGACNSFHVDNILY